MMVVGAFAAGLLLGFFLADLNVRRQIRSLERELDKLSSADREEIKKEFDAIASRARSADH